MCITLNIILVLIIIPNSLHSLPISSLTSSPVTLPLTVSRPATPGSWNTAGAYLHQDLCTCCSCCLDVLPPETHMAPSLTFSWLCSAVTLSESPAVITTVKPQHFQSSGPGGRWGVGGTEQHTGKREWRGSRRWTMSWWL